MSTKLQLQVPKLCSVFTLAFFPNYCSFSKKMSGDQTFSHPRCLPFELNFAGQLMVPGLHFLRPLFVFWFQQREDLPIPQISCHYVHKFLGQKIIFVFLFVVNHNQPHSGVDFTQKVGGINMGIQTK